MSFRKSGEQGRQPATEEAAGGSFLELCVEAMLNRSEHSEFEQAIGSPEAKIDLGHVALIIARPEYPELDVIQYVDRIDELAGQVRSLLPDREDAYRLIASINYVLFQREGFKGNQSEYYDPANSYLNRVIDRKTGIPITLSVLYMEVARRVGLDAEGVGFPGHFLVKVCCEDQALFIDVFNGGAVLGREELQGLLDRLYQGRLLLRDEFLARASKREIIKRMLNNLKAIYSNRGEFSHCLATVERLLLLEPGNPLEIRNRGVLYLQLDRPLEALKDFETFLCLAPDADGAAEVRRQVERLKRDIVIH